MLIPRINPILPAETQQNISGAFTTLEDSYAFCIGLAPEDRSILYKLGPETETFVAQMISLAQIHSDLIPRGMDLAVLAQRQAGRLAMREHHNRLQPLVSRIDSTIMLVGADILRDCLALYKVLKAFGLVEGLSDKLVLAGQRFARASSGLLVPKDGTDGTSNPATPAA